MSSPAQPNTERGRRRDGLEAAVDQAISACGGDLRSTIRALIVANDYLEKEVTELMKAVCHAYARGRFQQLFRLKCALPQPGAQAPWRPPSGAAGTRPLPRSIFAVRRVCYPRPRMSHCGRGSRPKLKQEEHVQTNSDRKSRRDRLPGHQDCAPYGDRDGSRLFRGRPRRAPRRNGR